MTTRIELRVEEVDGELVLRLEAPALLPAEPATVVATVADGVLELRAPRRAERVPGFHPDTVPD